MRKEIVEADVLCAGGGIAGLMAAIRAGELGANVVVAEKADSISSGSGGAGNDHFTCYIPEVHGADINPIMREALHSQAGVFRNIDFVRAWLEKSFDIIKMWDEWGIPMKYKGEYEFAGHAFPGRPLRALKYSGQDQKPILTREAGKRGAHIMNRVMVFDLFREDGIIGAVGIDTREARIIEFHAKSVILGTGLGTRLYPGPTPGWMFNMAWSPNNTGDGRAMAYRIGAEIVNAELPLRWAGPKYFARCGKATWVGVLRDPQGKPVAPFVTRPERKYGDVAADIWQTVFEDYAKSGKGPVYMDCSGISEEDLEYMMHWLKHEGNVALINALAEEGIDVSKNPVEFMTYEMLPAGGVYYNEKGETTVKGLYAAGDELLGGISIAAVLGWIAGGNAAEYAKTLKPPVNQGLNEKIKERQGLLEEIRNRETGASWSEANIALQQIMQDHAGTVRSETMLKAGFNHLKRLKERAYATLTARNQHELMHCLEVLNLLDLAELVFIAADERKETRGRHVRSDYPFTNPLLEKLLVIKKVDDKPVTEWKEIRR